MKIKNAANKICLGCPFDGGTGYGLGPFPTGLCTAKTQPWHKRGGGRAMGPWIPDLARPPARPNTRFERSAEGVRRGRRLYAPRRAAVPPDGERQDYLLLRVREPPQSYEGMLRGWRQPPAILRANRPGWR